MFVIGTAGHVDHGKSTLVEVLTGMDPDRLEEEKRRGLTIDLGFAWLTLPSGREVGIVDVPGHERFIRNMLAGSAATSVCLFVVAANEGWMPQSSEHLSAIHLLGITSGVVALTKADTADRAALESVRDEVRQRLTNTTLARAEIVPCSATTGAGLDDLVDALERALDTAPAPDNSGRPRLWVDRSFSMAGSGTVVTGTLTGGTLKVGDEVVALGTDGTGARTRIRGLQSHKEDLDRVTPGHRTAINVAGLDRSMVERGSCVLPADEWPATGRFNALLEVLDPSLSGYDYELTARGSHLMYVGTAEVAVRIRLLGVDRARGGGIPAQLYPARPLPLIRGDRFVLRDAGPVVTFGGGTVVDPLPPPVRRGDAGAGDLVRALGAAEGPEALRLLLDAEGELSPAAARRRTGVQQTPEGTIILGSRLLSPARATALVDRASDRLAHHHRDHPLERGMRKAALTTLLELEAHELDDLLALDDALVGEGPWARLRTHSVSISPAQEAARAALVTRLEEARFAPPSVTELDVDPALTGALQDSGELVKIAGFYLTSGLIDEMKELVTAAIEARGGLTVAEIRDLLGTTRKYAVPLCEWLDQAGVTRRSGDLRVRGPKA